MAQTFTGRKRVRKYFGHIREIAELPNLIEVQKASYDQFLQIEEPDEGREDGGLQAVFESVFPISDFAETAMLEFVRYEFEAPKYDVDECRQRGMTFAAPLKVTLRLIVFDVDEDTGAKSVKDIKEQDVLHGRHAAHDGQRHLHHQRHRARHRLADAPVPGRLLRSRQGQDALVGQAPLCRAHHSLSRLLARHRVRRQGRRARAHRPSSQAARHVAALRPRARRRGDPADLLRPLRAEAGQGRLAASLRRGQDARHQGRDRPDRRRFRRGRGRGRPQADRAQGPRTGREGPQGAQDLRRGGRRAVPGRGHRQSRDRRDLRRGGRRDFRRHARGAEGGRVRTRCRSSTSTTSTTVRSSATRWRSTRTTPARTRCSTSTG